MTRFLTQTNTSEQSPLYSDVGSIDKKIHAINTGGKAKEKAALQSRFNTGLITKTPLMFKPYGFGFQWCFHVAFRVAFLLLFNKFLSCKKDNKSEKIRMNMPF